MEVQIWKCLNKECGKTFPLAARITQKKTLTKNIYESVSQETIEFFCCPYCESKEFKPIVVAVEAKKENKNVRM